MELSPEDALRLNVLLVNKPQAIRIDESRMQLHALTPQGEAQIQLNPTCRDDQYLKIIREMLSVHVRGSPGGYPIFLQRWTRMGQMSDEHLAELLLLGEREAVVAAVHAPGLSNELAARAWWAMEDADNARQLLRNPQVVQGSVGPRVAAYLVEYLPFETEPENMIESVRLVLQPGLLSAAEVADLWKKAKRRNAYYVGFLATLPDDLPDSTAPHPLSETVGAELKALDSEGRALAGLMQRILSANGQAWLHTLSLVLAKPGNQEVVNQVLDIVADYFAAARPGERPDYSIEQLEDEAESWLQSSTEVAALRAIDERMPELLRVVRILSGLGYGVVRPIFRDTSAIGSLMRRKLEPVMTPLQNHLNQLAAS